MHLGPTTSELYCSMTRIYNIASFELDASPKDYKPTNFLNHKHSLRFLLSQSYELKKNIAKKEIVARELHGTLGVSHSTLNFISNFSFFTDIFWLMQWKWESHPSKQIFMFRGKFLGTYSWENTSTMRVKCLVHIHNRYHTLNTRWTGHYTCNTQCSSNNMSLSVKHVEHGCQHDGKVHKLGVTPP